MVTTAKSSYPKRGNFFALKFGRLMSKVCLANEIGPEACYLLTIIAGVEDAKSYRAPVTFWNEALLNVMGLRSASALNRIRQKAINYGWLHYEPGGRGVVGRYWVLIPKEFEGHDDLPIDENPDEYRTAIHADSAQDTGGKSVGYRKESGGEAVDNRSRSGGEAVAFLPDPVPVPEPREDPPNPPAGGTAAPVGVDHLDKTDPPADKTEPRQTSAKRERRPKASPEELAERERQKNAQSETLRRSLENVPIPAKLYASPDFLSAWAKWLVFRITGPTAKRITPEIAVMQLKKLAAFDDVPHAVHLVEHAVMGRYQGIVWDLKPEASRTRQQFKNARERDAEHLLDQTKNFLNPPPVLGLES